MTPDRIVHIPGAGLLPQDCLPRPPADIGFEERVRVVPPNPPWSPDPVQASQMRKTPQLFPQFDARYWQIGDAFTHHPNETQGAWVNNPGSGTPVVGHGCGLDRVPPVAEFRFKPKPRKQGLPDFWHSGSLFVVSSRLLELLLDMDPSAIAHRPIVMRDLGGAIIDREHHFIDVVRSISAVDYANSIIDYYGPSTYHGEPQPSRVFAHMSVRLREDIDPNVHIFRQCMHHRPGWGHGCLISNALKKRLEKMKPKPRNLAFRALHWGLS